MKPILHKKNLELFIRYIYERHMIYKRRFIQHQPEPWTEDPILKLYKFTNVFRFLDPGTQFVLSDIFPKCDGPEQAMFNLVIYRIYNKIETFRYVGVQEYQKFDVISFEKKLRMLAETQPVFTNAHIVNSFHFINPKNDKIGNSVEAIYKLSEMLDTLCYIIIYRQPSSKITYETLKMIPGIGDFLGYQIAVDLGYKYKELFKIRKN